MAPLLGGPGSLNRLNPQFLRHCREVFILQTMCTDGPTGAEDVNHTLTLPFPSSSPSPPFIFLFLHFFTSTLSPFHPFSSLLPLSLAPFSPFPFLSPPRSPARRSGIAVSSRSGVRGRDHPPTQFLKTILTPESTPGDNRFNNPTIF